MKRIVECVPNFSEGRRREIVDEIVGALASADGVRVLDVQSDADHNRSVVTMVGEPEAVEEAAARMADSTVVRFPFGHFEIYTGQGFEKAVDMQADFLATHLHVT